MNKSTFSDTPYSSGDRPVNTGILFGIVWVFLFILYYPAARAGFVTDYTGWLDQVKNHAFREYINRTNFHAVSLYQVTQLSTYIFYKLFGTNAWLWHLLFITLHSVNACLLYAFIRGLLYDAKADNNAGIPLIGVALFCVSPYMSEVIVWEPAYHFLTGLLFILVILRCAALYTHARREAYIWVALLVYAASLFTLEVFYITPWLLLALAIFYRAVGADKKTFENLVRFFFAPTLLLFIARLVLFYLLYGSFVSRIGSDTVTSIGLSSFGKPAKYLFHLLFVGRFFDFETKRQVYSFCDSLAGIVVFYGLVAAAGAYIFMRLRALSGNGKVASFLFACLMISLALLVPIWFGDSQLVLFDRYLYVPAAFFYTLFAVLVCRVPRKNIRIIIIGAFAIANLRFAIMASRYWGKSEKIIYSLLHDMPAASDKTVLLLNLPENMNGVAMIGSEKNSEYKLMHDLLIPDKPIKNTVYDVLSYNMTTPTDGARATVVNDSTIKVTLNQWGTWWWFEGKGGYSYETAEYKLDLKDPGHWYELTLKHPADSYMLLFEVGDQWKMVDMKKKGVDQN